MADTMWTRKKISNNVIKNWNIAAKDYCEKPIEKLVCTEKGLCWYLVFVCMIYWSQLWLWMTVIDKTYALRVQEWMTQSRIRWKITLNDFGSDWLYWTKYLFENEWNDNNAKSKLKITIYLFLTLFFVCLSIFLLLVGYMILLKQTFNKNFVDNFFFSIAYTHVSQNGFHYIFNHI